MNKFFLIKNNHYINEVDVIKNNHSNKNIVYLNKPKLVQNFALKLAKNLDDINNKAIDRAIEDLKKFVHTDYDLINCLKKGIVYHHGSVP